MELKDAIKTLQDNRANSVFDIYIPSLKKEYPWRFMTVAEQMSLSKMAMEDKQSVYYNGLMAVICCTYAGEDFEKDIGIESLTELDKMVILSELKRNSSIREMEYSISCPECSETFTHKIDIDKVIENACNISINPVDMEVTSNNIKYGFKLSFPKMKRNLELYKWAEGKDESEQLIEGVYGQLLSYIEKMYINDEEVQGFVDYSIDDKMNLFKEFPEQLMDQNDDNSIVSVLNKNFTEPISNIYSVKCANCENVINNFIDPESFFLNG